MKVRRIALALGAPAVIAAIVALPPLTMAQSSGGHDIAVREKVRGVKIVDVAPRAHGNRISRGDRLITQQALFDEAGAPIGTLYTDCVGAGATAKLPNATLYCTSDYVLRDGSITVAAVARLSRGATGAITGGTGAYRGASGEGESAAPPKGYDGLDVIHIDG